MLDILESLSKIEQKKRETIRFSSVAFIQSSQCRDLIEEAFRFEGIPLPSFVENSDELIQEYVRKSCVDIALVELNDSKNVIADMQRISHLLPNESSVVVIGQEDAISTIRQLRSMGFYYLFWPITKMEIVDFLKNVHYNREKDSGMNMKRDAKRIAIVGCSGGVGTSILAAELANNLAEKHKSKCLMVDHDFYAGNLDIVLKLDDFEKKSIGSVTVDADLDDTYAISMTKKVSDLLSILALTSDTHSNYELKEYTRALESLLCRHNNFIISDLSKGAQSNQDITYLSQTTEMVVFVFSPAISSVRQLRKMATYLNAQAPDLRQVFVLNHVRPQKASVLSLAEIEKILKRNIDIEIPYELSVMKHVLSTKFLSDTRSSIAKPISILTSTILGESKTSSRKPLFNWFLGK